LICSCWRVMEMCV